MSKTLFLKGTMKAEQPLHVIIKDSVIKGIQSMPRTGKDEAYFPATTIRGAFRHSIHKEVIRALGKNDDSMKLDEHFMIAQGVDITGLVIKENVEGLINQHKELRELNPAISLLGRWKLASKMGIGNALPIANSDDVLAIYGNGARTICFERDEALIEVLDVSQTERLQTVLKNQAMASVDKKELKDQQKVLLKAIKSADKEEKAKINEELGNLEQLLSEINKGEGGEGAAGIRRPIAGFEAFSEGTEFSNKSSLRNVEDLEVGLFLAGLRQFVRSPYLGAKQNLNFGLVSFIWEVTTFKDDTDLIPEKIGSIEVSCEGLELEGDYLQECLSNWDSVVNDLSGNGLDLKKVI